MRAARRYRAWSQRTWVMGDVVQVHMMRAATRARSVASSIVLMCCRRLTMRPYARLGSNFYARLRGSRRCSDATEAAWHVVFGLPPARWWSVQFSR